MIFTLIEAEVVDVKLRGVLCTNRSMYFSRMQARKIRHVVVFPLHGLWLINLGPGWDIQHPCDWFSQGLLAVLALGKVTWNFCKKTSEEHSSMPDHDCYTNDGCISYHCPYHNTGGQFCSQPQCRI